MKTFSIPRIGLTVNLNSFSHVFRNGDEWMLVTASGSQYQLTDEEHQQLVTALETTDFSEFVEMGKKLKEQGVSVVFN